MPTPFLNFALAVVIVLLLVAAFACVVMVVSSARSLVHLNAQDRLPSPTQRIPKDAPVSPGWTEHDAQTLRGYLASDTGKRFVLRLQATEYALAVAGSKDVMHTGHSAGVTTGYGQCVKHVQSLAHCGVAAEKVPTVPTEEDELAELERRYSP